MKLSHQAIQNLYRYIQNDETVYQVCDELLEVSNSDNPLCRDSLLSAVEQASMITVVPKGFSSINESYEELDTWATLDDLLLSLEGESILVCIPKKNALEYNIVNE